MTNEKVFLYAFILGLITIVAYFIRQWSKSDLKDCIVIFFCSSGILTGIKICCLTLDSSIALGPLSDCKLYLIVGGFCVIWLSVSTIFKCFKGK